MAATVKPKSPNPGVALFVSVAAWLVPGLGHLILRKWGRAAVYFLTVGALAVIGLSLRGNIFRSTGGDAFDMLGFLADLGAGIFYFCWRLIESAGPDVSREGVQRDILPIVEGSTITTKYGPVKTDHMLFIAAGAFHVSKPSDLIPEMQGRFPIRVELDSLTAADFERILTATDACLVRQYEALLETEQMRLEFRPDAVKRIAEIAFAVNEQMENIGARRLYTVMEKLLEDVSFESGKRSGQTVVIDAAYVDARLKDLAASEDLARYVL